MSAGPLPGGYQCLVAKNAWGDRVTGDAEENTNKSACPSRLRLCSSHAVQVRSWSRRFEVGATTMIARFSLGNSSALSGDVTHSVKAATLSRHLRCRSVP